jgi:hypothetical protein
VVYIYVLCSFDNVMNSSTFYPFCSVSEIHYLETELLQQMRLIALKVDSSTLKVTCLRLCAI